MCALVGPTLDAGTSRAVLRDGWLGVVPPYLQQQPRQPLERREHHPEHQRTSEAGADPYYEWLVAVKWRHLSLSVSLSLCLSAL